MKRSLILWIPIFVLFFVGPVLAVQFNHDEHQELLEDEPRCAYCHKEDADVIVPAEKVCLECHEKEFYDEVSFPGTKTHGPVWALNHRTPAKNGSINCSACHEQSYCPIFMFPTPLQPALTRSFVPVVMRKISAWSAMPVFPRGTWLSSHTEEDGVTVPWEGRMPVTMSLLARDAMSRI